MAAPKLTSEQRTQLLEWVAAEYSSDLIATWFAKREWPELTRPAVTYYRRRFKTQIATLRDERHTAALDSGLALKAERVQRLKEHADALEAIKWVPGENGRLFNEKAWREVLDDIAKEMGHRRTGVDVSVERELGAFLDILESQLSPEEFARVCALAAGAGTA